MRRTLMGLPLILLSSSLMAEVVGQGKVSWVIDGDTYWIQADDRVDYLAVTRDAGDGSRRDARNQFKLRLVNVDTPESVHVNSARNSAAGEDVSKLVISELKDKRIQYACDGVDVYKRPLCSVYLESTGSDYGLSLIERGYSPYVTHYKNGPHPHNDAGYRQAEEAAKSQKRGLWQ